MANVKVTKKKSSTAPVIMQNLQIRPVVRSSQDIEKWRSALFSAEAINPVRIPLYDLYDDLLLDGVLSSLIEKRILGVTKIRLAFQDAAGNEVPEMEDIIKSKAFRSLRKELMLQKVWGKKVIELMLLDEHLKIYSAPVKHIKPNLGKITFEQYGEDGIEYRLPPYDKFVVEVGADNDLGLLLKAAPYVIYKRGGFGDWANFAQIFGMPFRLARYDGYNQQVYAQLELALDKAGSAAYAILPKESTIEFFEAKNQQGSSQLYNDLRKACNEELCILILGQTETTTSSSSSGYAQSQTHLTVEESLNQSDREDELSIMNEQVLPVFANLGVQVDGGMFVHIPDKQQLGLKDKADVIVKLKNEGKLPIDDDYLYEEFGIPKPKDYDAQKKKQADSEAAAAAAAMSNANQPQNPKPPAAKKKADSKKLTAELNELYKGCCVETGCNLSQTSMRLGADDMAALLEKLIRRIWKLKGMPDSIDKNITRAFADELSAAVESGFGSTFASIDYDTPDGEMLAALQQDIYHFSAAKNYTQLKQLSQALTGEDGKLLSFAEFKQAAYEINNLHVGQWLKTEYNTAVSSSQFSAIWVRAQATKDTLPLFEFDAVMDARTTDLCRKLNGVVLPVDDPFWNKYYLPNHFGERSDIRQVSGKTITKLDSIETPEIPKMFQTNLAKNGVVFPPKHAYYIDLPDEVRKAGENLIP